MFKWLQLEMQQRKRRKAEDAYWQERTKDVTTYGRSTTVTIYPNHVLRDRSVQIMITNDTPHQAWYHFFSPEGALALLAQLEQERSAIEALARKDEI